MATHWTNCKGMATLPPPCPLWNSWSISIRVHTSEFIYDAAPISNEPTAWRKGIPRGVFPMEKHMTALDGDKKILVPIYRYRCAPRKVTLTCLGFTSPSQHRRDLLIPRSRTYHVGSGRYFKFSWQCWQHWLSRNFLQNLVLTGQPSKI